MPGDKGLSQADINALGKFSGNQINAVGDDLGILFDPETQDRMRADARLALLGSGAEIIKVQRVVPEDIDDSF